MNTMAEALRKAGLIQDIPEPIKEKTPMEQFREASVGSPVFARITIFEDAKFDWETGRDKPSISVWEGLVACEGTREVNIEESKWETRKAEQTTFRAMDDGRDLHKREVSNLRMKAPEARALEGNNFYVQEILKPTPELMKQYQSVRDDISMTIHAYVFPEFKAPSKLLEQTNENWPKLREVAINAREAMNNPLVRHVYQVKGLDNEVDAEKWLLKNHPEEAISFVYSTTTGNFNLQPSIDYLSRDNYLGTRAERESYIKELAAKHGIDIPPFDYREADKVLAGREAEKENFVVAYVKGDLAYPVAHGFDSALDAEHWREDKIANGSLSSASLVMEIKGNFDPAKPIKVEGMGRVGRHQDVEKQPPVWQPPKSKEMKQMDKGKTKNDNLER